MPPRLEGAHQRMGREVPAAILGQRRSQHGPRVAQHALALSGGDGSGKPCQHVPTVVDGAQNVVTISQGIVLRQQHQHA